MTALGHISDILSRCPKNKKTKQDNSFPIIRLNFQAEYKTVWILISWLLRNQLIGIITVLKKKEVMSHFTEVQHGKVSECVLSVILG